MDMNEFDKRQAEATARAGIGHPEMRGQGPNWEKFLADRRIVSITDSATGAWRVVSTSGQTYTVRRTVRVARDSGAYVNHWSCDCPARKAGHEGKSCRHVSAVYDMLAAELIAAGDYDAANELMG